MATLHHHPLCPHSRFIRLVLGEYGLEADLVEERVWERSEAFLQLDPQGRTPVFVEGQIGAVAGASVIAEYLDETRGLALGDRRLLPDDPRGRVEVRRLLDWFNGKMFAGVTDYLVTERVFKRLMPTSSGGGAPDVAVMRAGRNNIRYHLAYIGFLMRGRNWLAGDRLSYADLAAAAQISCADYLGDVPWQENEQAKQWYARIKSRPSFRPLLMDRITGMPPADHYADLDF
jgi:glutathione S-transferase